MRDGYQTICEKVGKWGCYALCLIHLAEKCGCNTKDPVSVIWAGMKNGFIGGECDVLDAAGFLSALTAQKWVCVTEKGTHKLPPTFKTLAGDLVVKEWHNDRTGFSHFTCDDYDGLTGSVTVKEGYVRSLRVFRRHI